MGRASAIRRSGLCGRGTFVLKVSGLRAPSLSDRSVPRCGRPDNDDCRFRGKRSNAPWLVALRTFRRSPLAGQGHWPYRQTKRPSVYAATVPSSRFAT
jgi:hypothetical protein